MSDPDQYGAKDDVDELHGLDDVERVTRFLAVLEQDPPVAARMLTVLTKRYGGDPLLTAAMLEWVVTMIGITLAEIHTLNTQVFGQAAAGGARTTGGIILPGS